MTKSERIEQWIRALRSGEYTQGVCALRSADNAYCCLGVLCDIRDASLWRPLQRLGWTYLGYDGILTSSVLAEYGLTIESQRTLTRMNDGDGKSFAEIADYIESTILPRVQAEEAA